MTRPIRTLVLVIAVLVLALPRAAYADSMRSFTTRHYNVLTDADNVTAREIAVYMDKMFEEYASRMSAFPAKSDGTSTLYLFAAAPAYHAFLDKLGYDARNTAGVFFSIGDETGLATFVSGQPHEQMLSTLRHEGFHQFAHARIGRSLPIWVNEGLAEYFGNGAIIDGQLRVGFAPAAPIERVRRAVDNDYSYSFDTLLAMTNNEWGNIVQAGGSDAGLLYDQAWLMTHFLVHGNGGRYTVAFERYLKLVSDGRSSLASFREAFGETAPQDFYGAWKRWLRGVTPDPISTAAERVEFLMRGIAFLDRQGVRVDSIAALREELSSRSYEVQTVEHGVERVTSSLDAEVFRAPPGSRASMQLRPPTARGALPTVLVVGLEFDVIGVWATGPMGERVIEIEYR